MSRPPCAGLWSTPMVQVDGRVTTCCLDEHLENCLGNLRERPLGEIWNGAELHAWRLAHIRGEFDQSGPLCTRCNWRSAGTLTSAEAEAYLQQSGEEALLQQLQQGKLDWTAGPE